MADYKDPDEWWNSTGESGIPWGSVDFGDRSDLGKVDSPRKNAWAINRAVYVGIPNQINALTALCQQLFNEIQSLRGEVRDLKGQQAAQVDQAFSGKS